MDTDPRDIDALLPLPPATFHILMALTGGDRHGYGIIQDVEERTDRSLRLSAGTLYRTLQRLVERNMIVEVRSPRVTDAADDPRRRYYRITSFGTSVARAETSRLGRLVSLARESGLAAEAP